MTRTSLRTRVTARRTLAVAAAAGLVSFTAAACSSSATSSASGAAASTGSGTSSANQTSPVHVNFGGYVDTSFNDTAGATS